jgi:PAS domain S-box-containing protein
VILAAAGPPGLTALPFSPSELRKYQNAGARSRRAAKRVRRRGQDAHGGRPRNAPIARGIAIAKTTPHQPGQAGSGSLRELRLICLGNLLASTEERVYFKDLMSRFLFVSEGWIEAVAPGRTAGELAGKTDFDVFTEEHAAAAFADEQEIIRTGQPIVGQVERETFSGRPDTWVSTTKVPLRDDDGEIIGTFGISRDITAQIRAESALAWQAGKLGAQNERLRELDRLKDEFVALVSHELRTPLTSIIGYIQLLRDERASGLDTDHFAEVIERNAERLLRLVGDLLFLSKMQSGQLALELRETDLASLAGQAVEEARPEAERKHIDLILTAAPVPGSVDPTRIAQLLGNLITNAVKFTPEGGTVEVRLGTEDGQAVLSVADTGIGIPAADRERVFERFYRTEAATRRVIPGSGLGLTISRAIVDAHGGTIMVRSDGKHGSTFTVRLPLALGGSAPWCPHRWCGLASGQPPAARIAISCYPVAICGSALGPRDARR